MLAALVLTVLTQGTAAAVVLQQNAAGTPVATVLAEPDLGFWATWEVPATPVEVDLVGEPAPSRPAPAAAAPGAAGAPEEPSGAPEEPSGAPEEPSAVRGDPLCRGEGWQQRRGSAALASLRRPSDAAPFRVSFEPGRRGTLGLANLPERRLQVFVRPCAELSTALLRHVVAHELGHLVDTTRLDDADRAAWRTARGIPVDMPWYGCSSCTDFATPAGDFAEVYAQWQTGASRNRSKLAPAPSTERLAELATRFF